MKIVRYRHGSRTRLGALDVEREQVLPLAPEAAGSAEADLVAVIRAWDTHGPPEVSGRELAVRLSDIHLTAPVPAPGRNIFCVGKNYHEHADEFAASGFDATGGSDATPSHPIVFTKPDTTVIGPGDLIEPHAHLTSALDYEAEVAVIIGRGGRAITPADAWQHVWGYTLVNDVTARDLQKDHKQWFLGKSLDTFCPMGPWAVSLDELHGSDVVVECHVNGELRQSASTKDLIFDIPTLVATLSAGITLRPGDIIATGTPAGVGVGFDPPRFLEPGDEVTVSATGLGSLTNRVAEVRHG